MPAVNQVLPLTERPNGDNNTAANSKTIPQDDEVAPELATVVELEEKPSEDMVEFRQDEFDDLDYTVEGKCAQTVDSCMRYVQSKLSASLPVLKYILAGLAVAAYFAYFGYSMYCSFGDEGSLRLLWLTCGVVFFAGVYFFKRFFGEKFYNAVLAKPIEACSKFIDQHSTIFSIVGTVAFLAYFFGFIIGIGSQNSGNLISGVGVLTIILITLLLSAHPTRVNWRPVMGGLTIQITFAALLLRTQPGYQAFSFVGDRVAEFIQHVDAGAEFVFGADFRDHFFAFSVLSVIVFFSSFIALLFHLEVLQVIIEKLGWLMQKAMGTTSGESLVAAANIFIGQTEAPLLIRPFVGRMTNSELHAVITSGFATIAGGVLAAYIGLGVEARHLLSASVMVAPGALALSKIMYPETKQSKTDSESIKKVKMGSYRNAIDAMGTGAINSIPLVGAIAVNLIAFISMLTFLNTTLTWFGRRACLNVDLTFELICGYLFWPIAYVIGISSIDCSRVAELIGVKFFINEFVAYQRFNTYRTNRIEFLKLNSTDYYWEGNNVILPNSNTTLVGGLLFEDRSLTIVTYALCGFANISSIGIQLGMFSVLTPKRKNEIVPLVLRGVITGTLANLLTASIAGIFYNPTST
ncbi:hypothetical protein BOX15_Mlig010716g2 [Macrostomum lignano]|uniref:Sodium/nucleoside cotransporter n=1 Tax=Macrostomum lignano TaxID=282301 RepID=A0A267DNH8_9PLAT|nr:hypothetical protein BOX15_Mlig010716g2 [Macrostomum lignano]